MKRFLLLLLILHVSQAVAGAELKPYRGAPLPPFALEDTDGKTHRLSDYRGKVILVNFWATWCPPCVKEMPAMQRLRTKLGEKAFRILALNVADDEESVRDFVHKAKLNFSILMDREGAVGRDWRVYALPASFVLNAKGDITHRLYGALEWDSPEVVALIESLLPEPVRTASRVDSTDRAGFPSDPTARSPRRPKL